MFAWFEDGDGNGVFAGFGGLAVVVGVVMWLGGFGPFEGHSPIRSDTCVRNGLGAEFCGEEAKSYCRDVSDKVAGRTAACDEVLGGEPPVESDIGDGEPGSDPIDGEDLDGNGMVDAEEDLDGSGVPDGEEDLDGNGTPDIDEY